MGVCDSSERLSEFVENFGFKQLSRVPLANKLGQNLTLKKCQALFFKINRLVAKISICLDN